MVNTKIIATECHPDMIDFSRYFDGDGYTSDCGDFSYSIFIPKTRVTTGFNDELDYIKCDIENLFEKYLEKEEEKEEEEENKSESFNYDEFKDLVIDYSRYFTPYDDKNKLKELKTFLDTDLSHITSEIIAEFLSICTDKEWGVREFTGYSQGDYCEIIYCKDSYSNETITEIGKMWLGCGTEFIIAETDGREVGGYFVIDDIVWEGGEALKQKLEDISGNKIDEVYLFDDYKKVPQYKRAV